MNQTRILIAGVGNIFLGDDAFGVEVAQRPARGELPKEVRVVDFGIRGLDLTYALLEGYETVILVDALPHGGLPGTLYLLEPDGNELAAGAADGLPMDAHSMDPVKVLRLMAALGGKVENLFVFGCEPTVLGDMDDIQVGMSDSVAAVVDEAVSRIELLIAQLLRGEAIAVQ